MGHPKSKKHQDHESSLDIQSEVVHKGRIISVRKDLFLNQKGEPQQYDIVLHPGAVAILPIDDEGFFYFVKQWRRAANTILLELPAGTLEPSENPLDCAVRELQEEISYRPQSITLLGHIFTAPGFSNEYIHLYLAEGLIYSPLKGEDSDDIDVVKFKINDVLQMVKDGTIQDAKTLSSILMYLEYKNKLRDEPKDHD